jgi:hypothetical protein
VSYFNIPLSELRPPVATASSVRPRHKGDLLDGLAPANKPIKSHARKIQFPESIQRDLGCPVPACKFISLVPSGKSPLRPRPVPYPQEGRIAIVTKRWARNAVDARVSLRAFGVQGERCQCGRRSRVVLTPRRWRQGRGFKSAADGGKRARSPGRARSKRNTTARGKPDDSVYTCGE